MSSSKQTPPFYGNMDDWTWYHGAISRKRAIDLLNKYSNGTFLVRDSTTFTGDLALSVADHGKIKHYRIQWLTTPDNPNRRYTIDYIKFFKNMPGLINHYSSKSQRGLCTRLVWGLPKISTNDDSDYVPVHAPQQLMKNQKILQTPERKRVTGSLIHDVCIVEELISLNKRVEDLEKEYFEMWRGRKILLFHGVFEEGNDDVVAVVLKIIKESLKLELSSADIISALRFGHASYNSPRPILVKFNNVDNRDSVWYNKDHLKGTGIKISEFLTKDISYKAFVEAHKRFGITKCWIDDGLLVILAVDGTEHRVTSLSELINIQSSVTSENNIASRSDDKTKRRVLFMKRYLSKILYKCSRIFRNFFCHCQ